MQAKEKMSHREPAYKNIVGRDVENSVCLFNKEKSKNPRSNKINCNCNFNLHTAVKLNDKPFVKQLLSATETNVNIRNRMGEYPLHIAVKNGAIDMVKLLLSKEIWINVRNKEKYTPLHIAVQNNLIVIVKLLISKKSKINTRNLLGNSPLHDAVNNTNLSMVELLLRNGADPNCLNKDKTTPFHSSLTKFDVQLIKLFLQYNVNPHLKNYCGENALHLASEYSTKEIMQRILEMNVSSNEPTLNLNPQYCTDYPIHYVLKSSWTEEVTLEKIRLLVKFGARVDEKDTSGKTALFFAIQKRYCKLVQYLLKQDANVNCCGVSGWNSPLFVALRVGDADIVDVLLKHGADIKIKTKHGDGPLHIAASIFRHDTGCSILELLLDHGAPINDSGSMKSTALHEVLNNRDSKMFNLLINRGAAVNAKDSRLHTPLHIAICKNMYQETKRLLEMGASVNDKEASKISAIKLAIIHSTVNMVRLLLQYGANAKEKTLMTAAAKIGNLQILQLLVSRGADVNEYEANMSVLDNGITSIKPSNLSEIVQYLLDAGANVNFESNAIGPLSQALKRYPIIYPYRKCVSVVEILLKHMALLSAQNLYLNKQNLKKIKYNCVLREKYKFYSNELERMKSTRVCENLSVTYFDLLVMRNTALSRCLRFLKVRDALASSDDKYKFKNYFDQLEDNCRNGLYRLQIMQQIEKALDGIFNGALPREIVWQITEYLNEDDFKYYLFV